MFVIILGILDVIVILFSAYSFYAGNMTLGIATALVGFVLTLILFLVAAFSGSGSGIGSSSSSSMDCDAGDMDCGDGGGGGFSGGD